MSPQKRYSGFTLVELLVVIAIIGVLIGLLLPAVQSAREAGRRTACGNNVRQIALAAIQHESQRRFFPSGGWGWCWTGDPDRGSGRSQPGSWAYALLPNLELNDIFQLGSDGQPDVLTSEQLDGVATAAGLPIPIFTCVSRRPAVVRRVPYSAAEFFKNATPFTRAYKSDYAANGGSVFVNWGRGPESMAEALAGNFTDMSSANGLSYQCSEVRPQMITDGLSKTYLLGEKYLDPTRFGFSQKDDQSMLQGDAPDMHSWTHVSPLRDKAGTDGLVEFGSAHPSGFWMAYADGSLRSINYDVEPVVHSRAGSRDDGQVTAVP